jgi:uncharacterized membrane protein YoaK (UPF0700 family)
MVVAARREADETASSPQESLLVAMLLSAAGGFLDAYTWLAYGGVFATAQTGNAVLVGVHAASGQWTRALQNFLPIAAFAIGVFVASRLRARAGEPRAALISLVVEIVLLGVVMAMPSAFPGLVVTLGISFVAALQNSSFGKVEGWHYNSVIATGDLSQSVEALVGGMIGPRDRRAMRQARVFATICVTFLVGAGFGAMATEHVGHRALALPAVLLLLVLSLCVAETPSRKLLTNDGAR